MMQYEFDKSEYEVLVNYIKDGGTNDICIVCHENPDGDALGSAYALREILTVMGKKAFVYPSGNVGEKLSFLAEKNEVFEPKHVISVDVAAPEILEKGFPYADRIDFAVDHHSRNTLTAKEKLVKPEKGACGEIIFELALALGIELNEKIATCLYTAIATDTGRFMFSNTTDKTYEAASVLYKYCPKGKIASINNRVFNQRNRSEIELTKLAIDKMMFLFGGRVAILALTEKMKKQAGAVDEDENAIVQLPKSINGVEIGIVLKERGEGVFKASVRSNENFDASEFCAEFGGGGHRCAAGCTLHGDEKTAVEAIINKLEKCYK